MSDQPEPMKIEEALRRGLVKEVCGSRMLSLDAESLVANAISTGKLRRAVLLKDPLLALAVLDAQGALPADTKNQQTDEEEEGQKI